MGRRGDVWRFATHDLSPPQPQRAHGVQSVDPRRRSVAVRALLKATRVERLKEILPEALGAAHLVSGEGGWKTLDSDGDVNVRWALTVLRSGEARLYDDVDVQTDEVEAVMRTPEGTHVVVADGRGAVVLRLENTANLGMALGFAHAVVRTGAV